MIYGSISSSHGVVGLRQIDQIKAEVNLRHVVQRVVPALLRGQLAAGLHKRIPRNDGAEIIRPQFENALSGMLLAFMCA